MVQLDEKPTDPFDSFCRPKKLSSVFVLIIPFFGPTSCKHSTKDKVLGINAFIYFSTTNTFFTFRRSRDQRRTLFK